jgi:hypothetical protein
MLLVLLCYYDFFYIVKIYHKFKFKLFKFKNFTSASNICFAPYSFILVLLNLLIILIFTLNLDSSFLNLLN